MTTPLSYHKAKLLKNTNAILKCMQDHGDQTADQIAAAVGLTDSTARVHLHRLHNSEKKVHIGRYDHPPGARMPVAIWTLGKGKHAEPPEKPSVKPKTPTTPLGQRAQMRAEKRIESIGYKGPMLTQFVGGSNPWTGARA